MGTNLARGDGRTLAKGETVIDVRALSTPEEMRTAVALQKSIWGFDDIELLPVRLFIVATKIGGQVFGAYHGHRMVGFSLAIPGLKPGARPYLHSHIVGVEPNFRDLGLGRTIKLRQREAAIAAGLDLMEWTFDPLEVKNAYFNIERLGAIVRRFVRNQYGMTSSHLHRGLPTDRCTAEWWIQSDRVDSILRGEQQPRLPVKGRVCVPLDLRLAHAAQARMSDQFCEYFDRGLVITGFERGEQEGTYLLTQWP